HAMSRAAAASCAVMISPTPYSAPPPATPKRSGSTMASVILAPGALKSSLAPRCPSGRSPKDRLAAGAAAAPAHREVAVLLRMVKLAVEHDKALRVPIVHKPKEGSGPARGLPGARAVPCPRVLSPRRSPRRRHDRLRARLESPGGARAPPRQRRPR